MGGYRNSYRASDGGRDSGGCINHATTAQAVANDGLPLIGWWRIVSIGTAHYAEIIDVLGKNCQRAADWRVTVPAARRAA